MTKAKHKKQKPVMHTKELGDLSLEWLTFS